MNYIGIKIVTDQTDYLSFSVNMRTPKYHADGDSYSVDVKNGEIKVGKNIEEVMANYSDRNLQNKLIENAIDSTWGYKIRTSERGSVNGNIIKILQAGKYTANTIIMYRPIVEYGKYKVMVKDKSNVSRTVLYIVGYDSEPTAWNSQELVTSNYIDVSTTDAIDYEITDENVKYIGIKIVSDQVTEASISLNMTIPYYNTDGDYSVIVEDGYAKIGNKLSDVIQSSFEQNLPYDKLLSIGRNKIICIGDSLTETSNPVDVTYPEFVERITNVPTHNEGHSGATPITWWNSYGKDYDFTPYNIFIVWLGTNDGLTDTLDTDVKPYNSYSDFANTNTGCYCKIIKKIIDTVQNPKIFVGTVYKTNGNKTITNSVIRKIASLYDYAIVGIVDNDLTEYTEGEGQTDIHPYGGDRLHVGTYGNLLFANNWVNGIKKLIKNNTRMFARGDNNLDRSLKFNFDEYSVDVGSTVNIVAVSFPIVYRINNWTSSNQSVATVSDGVVSGLSVGSTTITATTIDGRSAEVTVVVN